MSSFLDKLRALVSANIRGPRRRPVKPEAHSETAETAAPLPDVTETASRREKPAEVTDATDTTSPAVRRVDKSEHIASRIEEPVTDEDQPAVLDEKRVIDLLNDSEA